MLILIKNDTPEAAVRSLVIQLSRQGIGAARADSGGAVQQGCCPSPTRSEDREGLRRL